MAATLVGLAGEVAGKRFTIGSKPITFGRGEENDIVLATPSASRLHAELRAETTGYVLYDRGSTNGTWVNGNPVAVHQLKHGDQIMIGEEVFAFETTATRTTLKPVRSLPAADRTRLASASPQPQPRAKTQAPVLRVTITGGGPVGLAFALLLEQMMGARVAIRIYDGRWTRDGGTVVWKGPDQGNVRRQQVVTIQSRQYLKLPAEVQERLFALGSFTEMWPKGPDSIEDAGPRNVRIMYVEDQLLALANEKAGRIELIRQVFDAADSRDEIVGQHVLAICEGSRSKTLQHFAGAFGV